MKLQIVDGKGQVIDVPTIGPLALDLENTVVAAIKQHPIGFLRTEAQVERAIRQGLHDAFYALTKLSRYVPR